MSNNVYILEVKSFAALHRHVRRHLTNGPGEIHNVLFIILKYVVFARQFNETQF